MINKERLNWFQDARFGLFIHWGLHTVLAGEWKGQRIDYIGEWIQSQYRIPKGEYEKLAAQFNPTGFDADEWVRLAKRAGMRYVVYGAKHHEGFAMYRSACDPYNIVDATMFHRDPLQELADACRRHDMRLGVYYSQDLDWHEPDAGDPGPAFPKNFGMSWGNDWDFPDHSKKNFAQYFENKVKPQVRELLTQYGPISMMWFDCPLTISREQCVELWNLVRELQPDCLVNTRLGHGLGDFSSMGDNEVPSGRVQGAWETPATMNDTWGYKHFDQNWKPAADTLGILVALTAKGVNYLLNSGPQPDGRLPEASVKILNEIGNWMTAHGEAIHGTRASPFPYSFEWGWVTQRPQTATQPTRLYLLFKEWPTTPFCLRGLRNRVLTVSEMTAIRNAVPFNQTVDPRGQVHELTLRLLAKKPSACIPVVVLELDGEIDADQRLLCQYDDCIVLPADCGTIHAEVGSASDVSRDSTPVGAAGERMTAGVHPSVNHTGLLVNWLDERDWIDWEVYVPAAGEYAAAVVTSSVYHSNPWTGGHRVRLETSDSSVEAAVKLDVTETGPEARYYPQVMSRCGKLRFGKPGSQKLALTALEIRPNKGIGLALVAVRLRRIKQ